MITNFYREAQRGVSSGGTVCVKFTGDPATFTSLSLGTGTSMEISDDGSTWSAWDNSAHTVVNGEVYVRGMGKTTQVSNFSGSFTKVEGPVVSLVNYKDLGQVPGYKAFYRLFYNCTTLEDASLIELTETPSEYCYSYMFGKCAGLKSTPKIKGKMNSYTCYYMFSNSGIETLPDISGITSLSGKYCFSGMFNSCNSLTVLPSNYLTFNSVPERCYSGMFEASGVTHIPSDFMAFTSVGKYGCAFMFSDCKSLTTCDMNLTVSSSGDYAYRGMFYDCTSLSNYPDLSKVAVSIGCFAYMFRSCPLSETLNVNLPASTVPEEAYSRMFYDISSKYITGHIGATTVEACGMQWMFVNSDLIESVDVDLISEISSLGSQSCDSMFSGCKNLNNVPKLNCMNLGNYCYRLMFEGCHSLENVPYDLLPATTLKKSCYSGMFSQCYNLKNAPDLPATDLAENCYGILLDNYYSMNYSSGEGMFNHCEELTVAAKMTVNTLAKQCCTKMYNQCYKLSDISTIHINATEAKEGCFHSMFRMTTEEESSLNSVMDISSITTLAPQCFRCMYSGNRLLTTVPTNYLPCTTLEPYCYAGMFSGCRELTQAPILYAENLVEGCYGYNPEQSYSYPFNNFGMFAGCSKLSTIACAAKDTTATNCIKDWMKNVSSTGDFYGYAEMNPETGTSASKFTRGDSGVPTSWTYLDV